MEKQPSLPDWSDKTLLIAEDTDDNFIILSALLKKTGITIFRARDGREAVDMIGNLPSIDLILMDISMPSMDGIEATRLIKKKFPGKVIIAQTAHNKEIKREQMIEEGCNDYLIKPIRQKLLIETLSKYLSSPCSSN